MTMSMDTMIQLFSDNVVRYHEVPLTIILDRDVIFMSKPWKNFREEMGTQPKFIVAFHPQMDGQSKSTIQVLEDLLRLCVLNL